MSDALILVEMQMAKLKNEHKPLPGEFSPQTKLLIGDLEERRTEENSEEIDAIIEAAKKEKFHSWLSDLPMPIRFLRKRLQEADLWDLDEKVVEGRYDCPEKSYS
mgnify:CR=1 FL=1